MTDLTTPQPAQPASGDAMAGFQSFCDARAQLRDATSDPALKAHFDAEIANARLVIAQSSANAGGADQAGGADGIPGVPSGPAPSVTGDPAGGEDGFPEYSDETNGGGTGAPGGNKPVSERPKVDGVGGSDSIPAELQQYSDVIMGASEATGVPANILSAIIWDESKGNLGAASTNGGNGGTDTGLMQVNPETFKSLQEKYPDLLPPGSDLSDPAINVMAGACYLMDLNQQFGGDWNVTYRAYNSGPLNVNPNDLSDISKYNTGTVTYVDKINYYLDQIESGTALSDGYPGGNGNW